MCLRNVSSRGNSSSGGNSSSFNVSSKCVFASSFTYPPWQKCVFEMCLRLRAEKCVHQCAHNDLFPVCSEEGNHVCILGRHLVLDVLLGATSSADHASYMHVLDRSRS